MSFKSAITFIFIITALCTTAFAQDSGLGLSYQNQVLTDNSQTIFLSGKIQTGWAGNIYNGSNTSVDSLKSQFFINRAYFTLTSILNDNVALRIRFDGIDEMNDDQIIMKNAYVKVENITYLGITSRLYFGIVNSVWESFENEIWRYRILRNISASMFDYINETEVGANYFMNFNNNQVSLRVGIWNGDYKKYSTLGFGDEVNEEFEDPNYSAGAFLFYSDQGYTDTYNNLDGLIIAFGGMLNSQPGDTDDANIGYRVLGGLYFIFNRADVRQLLTVGLSGGYISDHKKVNEFDNEVTDNKFFVNGFFLLNFAAFSAEARNFELIFRIDYNYDGRQGEGYLLPEDDVNQFGITIGVSYKPYSWLWIIPAFKGDYVDLGQDVNLIGLWIELRY